MIEVGPVCWTGVRAQGNYASRLRLIAGIQGTIRPPQCSVSPACKRSRGVLGPQPARPINRHGVKTEIL